MAAGNPTGTWYSPFAGAVGGKRWRSIDAIGLVMMVTIAITIAYLAHSKMERIREGLAPQLFDQHSDIVALESAVVKAAHQLDLARPVEPKTTKPLSGISAQRSARLALGGIISVLAGMWRSYSFDSLVGASTAHAFMMPSVDDVSCWLADGVHGYRSDSPVVMDLAYRRFRDAATELALLRQ